jgi:hypothetical protein
MTKMKVMRIMTSMRHLRFMGRLIGIRSAKYAGMELKQ